MSIAGLGAVLWSIIEAPTRGWSDPAILAVGAAGLAILAAFARWEKTTTHPLLNLRFFSKREFSAAIPAVATVTFGLYGALTAIQSSLGGALAVAAHVGGTAGQLLAHLARTAFVSGMDLGLFTAALVAVAGALLVLAWLPGRPGRS
jgi:hypothetical protein